MGQEYICSPKSLKLHLHSVAVRAALSELMDHACHVHGFKTACEAIVETRESVDKAVDYFVRELENCLRARKV